MKPPKLTATIEIGSVPATPKARKELAQRIAADLAELARSVNEPWFAAGLEQRLAKSARLADHGHQASGTLILEIGPQPGEEKTDA